MKFTTGFILASRSPRRRQLLRQAGFSFRIVPSTIDEIIPRNVEPESVVQRLAFDKALPISRRSPHSLVLGADTIVTHNNTILGKPADGEEAKMMLRSLSGNTHTVYTGIALIHGATKRRITTFESTDITFATLSDQEIEAYVATGSPMDKAGAYGIQDDMGAIFVTRINGDYFTVVGLPLRLLYHTIKEEFADLLIP